uniref:Putative polycomb protein suz12-b n=1 Tax=Panstrongylus lignarius TaxID=156445 RepID=A0A224X807_9HEMI
MPPKRREKDTETGKNKPDSNGDHEQFLQAFEKPTQIYRYLRTRNMLKPVFLYRTLSYMKHRMSRSNKGRSLFKVDSLLQTTTNKLQQQAPLSGFLTLTFLGFYNKSCASQQEPVKVETLLLKICHKKRKDVSCPVMTVSLGTSYVPYNPSEERPPAKAPTVSIPTESFSLSGHVVKSYHLLLRVAVNSSSLVPDNINTDDTQPALKKRKYSKAMDEDKVITLGTDLVIYDKQNRCLLTDGDYEFYLEELKGSARVGTSLSTWEDMVTDSDLRDNTLSSFEKLNSGPTLKFRLCWSREAVMPMVDRPSPLIPANELTTTEHIQHETRGPQNKHNGNSGAQVVYQFIYNSDSKQQTEASSDMHCPWCSLNCMTLYSLLKHLKLCHPRFNFSYVPVGTPGNGINGGQNCNVRIDVCLNESYDGTYYGCPQTQGPGGGVMAGCSGGSGRSGGGPVRRTPLSHLIVCHPKRSQPNSLTEFLDMEDNDTRPYITGHNRLYHHTTTCLPIYPKEMDIDSEDETDPRWLQKKTMMMIDEFTDVNEGEKELMKMWNLHIMRHGFVGDCQVALSCTMFIEEKGRQLLEKNLYRNFVLHMCSLFDFGLVSPVTLFTTMQKVQEIIQSNENINKLLQESWQCQREHWNSVDQKPWHDDLCSSGMSPSGANPSDSGQRRSKPTPASDKKPNKKGLPTPTSDKVGRRSSSSGTTTTTTPDARRRLSLPAPNKPELRRKVLKEATTSSSPLRRRSLNGPTVNEPSLKKKTDNS